MASITKATTKDGRTRYRVRWRVDGRTVERWAPTLAAARALKTQAESDALTGVPLDPKAGIRVLNDYFAEWIVTRLVKGRALSPSTRIGYERLWRRTVASSLGHNQLRALRPEMIRSWHSDVTIRAGSDQAAKAYRLLRAVLATAEADELLRINPCRIRGGGQEHHQERPMVATALVLDLAEAIEPRYRALVLVAGFAGLRTGESLGLGRSDVDLLHGELRIAAQAQELAGRGRTLLDPKSEAGRRVVAIPAIVADSLETHLHTFHRCRSRGMGLHRPERYASATRHAVKGMAGGGSQDWCALGSASTRSTPPRSHPHGEDARRHDKGAHGPNRTCFVASGAHLPARHRRTRPRHRVLSGHRGGRYGAGAARPSGGATPSQLWGWRGVGAR